MLALKALRPLRASLHSFISPMSPAMRSGKLVVVNERFLSTAATAGPVTIPPVGTSPLPEKQADSAETPKPEKIKFRERSRIYLKTLYKDYRDVFFETVEEAKAKPTKATFYIVLVGGVLYCIWTVPEERDFYQSFVNYRESLDLCAAAIRNPDTEQHINELNRLETKGLLRYQSLGLLSIMWKHNEDEMLGTYDAQCTYRQPLYSEMWGRLVDVGFLGKWWILQEKMKDYDVNVLEWEGQKLSADSQVTTLSSNNEK